MMYGGIVQQPSYSVPNFDLDNTISRAGGKDASHKYAARQVRIELFPFLRTQVATIN
jgi:hypothetical protein